LFALSDDAEMLRRTHGQTGRIEGTPFHGVTLARAKVRHSRRCVASTDTHESAAA
jgi:hypothetical protein